MRSFLALSDATTPHSASIAFRPKSSAGRAQGLEQCFPRLLFLLTLGMPARFSPSKAGGGVVTLLKIGRSIVGIRGNSHAPATTSRHACMAEALKARCVLAEVRWRWTLNVL